MVELSCLVLTVVGRSILKVGGTTRVGQGLGLSKRESCMSSKQSLFSASSDWGCMQHDQLQASATRLPCHDGLYPATMSQNPSNPRLLLSGHFITAMGKQLRLMMKHDLFHFVPTSELYIHKSWISNSHSFFPSSSIVTHPKSWVLDYSPGDPHLIYDFDAY